MLMSGALFQKSWLNWSGIAWQQGFLSSPTDVSGQGHHCFKVGLVANSPSPSHLNQPSHLPLSTFQGF